MRRKSFKPRIVVRPEYVHCLPITDMIAQGELAKLLGVSTQAVSNWKVRYRDFPQPIISSEADHLEIYLWSEVKQWIRRTSKTWVVR